MVDIVHRKTICLNMIVKNESHIIASTLKNILEHIKIDSWVISDTGSTDDTVDIIQHFFKERGISGEIFHDKWKDFGHNRTKALEHAYDKSDYLFIFDADDLIHGDMQLPSTLDKDTYDLQFGNPVSYHRSILISNRMKWKYVGVLHELLHNVDPIKSRGYLLGNYNIQSRRLGDRSKNPNKYVDDALVLEKGFQEENTDMWLKYRYAYYCAQSYNDAGKWEKAIEWYERTLTLDYSPQYKYCACVRAGDCYNVLKQYSNAIDSWSKAYFYDKERLEGIVKIMEYFYNKEQHFMVSSLYNKFKHVKIGNAKDKIFLDYSKYHDFHYFASVSGCYCDEYKSAYEACKYMLLNNRPNSANTIYNLKFYMKHFKEDDDNKSLLDYFVTYIMDPQIIFKERKNAWNIVNSIIKEQLLDKYEILENIITTPQKKNIDKNSKYASSKNILIYTGYMNFLWNDSTLNKKAIGGAEKAVIYLTRNLPNNYTIYIAGDQKEEELDNIKYINHSNLQKLLDNTIFHSIIVSRYVSFFKEFDNIKCYKMLLSAHDSTGFINFKVKNITINNILLEYNKYIDNVICLTKWHSSNIVERHPFLTDKINIINNGIDISQFIFDKPKIKNKFVWSSCSYRGLIILLNLWEELLESIPDATLDICSYDIFPKNKEDEKMLEIINMHSSITHHGKLNTKQLYDLMSISEYWLYTNTFPETSCITAMEMLMSGVICLYYPLAGLIDTIGNYGIQVTSGNEIETIMNLSEETKAELIKNGKEYALTCSWGNRAEQWCNMLGLNIKNHKIGIFNSFPFHYEMFGFILNYAKNNEILVDIFTNRQNNLGWIDFYRNKFNNFNVIDFKKFEGNTDNYSTFFVTTDDDPLFKTEWIDNNVVCLNHYYKIRAPNFKHYLNIANFKDSLLDYSYPCYPLINYKEKKQNNTVSIIGASYGLDFNIINKLCSNNKIQLNIFVRKSHNIDITELDTTKFNINFMEDIHTNNMIKLLKQSSYILINYNSHPDRENGTICSGSLQLALSTLCRPIMTQNSNKYLQIENALKFDINSNEPINIDGEIDFKAIEQERNKYVDKFESLMNIYKIGNYFNLNKHSIGMDKENLCLLTYGELRTLKNNFRNNLLEFLPILQNYKNTYIFILLDEKKDVRDEHYEYIENICKEFNIKIGFIETMETSNLNKEEEKDYCNTLLLQKNDHDKQFPNNFVLNLLYRKYKLIELVEEYCIDNKLEISYFLYARLFDCIIKQNIPSNDIYLNIKNTNLSKHIYFSPDTIFIGNYNLIKKVMKFDKIYNSDELWNNKDFCNFSYRFDSKLTNNEDTYAPEIQYTANIYFQSINAYNLRYYRPDPNCLDKNLMYEIILDPNRHTNNSNEYSNDFINLNLTTKNIIEITNRLDNKYLKYFSDSGFNDYKQQLGKEHYKLLCVISSQIDNGIIIDIGTHHGNSAIALGYNLYKNINNICNRPLLYTFDIKDFRANSCKKFMNNYSVHYSLENVFNCNIRDKYKNALLESKLIIIDIDPHNGVLEYELYNWLFENNYKGLILFDDIYLTQGHVANGYEPSTQSMEIFWNKIPNKYKLDLTHIGHWSGTGLVSFNTNNTIKLDSNNIPKKLFQTWEHSNIEPDFQEIIDIWKNNNLDYEYIFHDSGQRLKFIEENFEENVVNAYNKIIPGAYKCDLWRYCVLYIYGGFYADIDTLCMGKLNDLISDNIDFIVPIDLNINPREGQHNLACGFIGSVSKSPILLDAINRIVFNVENNIIPPSKLDFSGPGVLGRSVNKFLKLEETSSFNRKQGIKNTINFLHFDPQTEYITDVNTNKIILQNKNKNSEIIRLYNNECNKIKNYTCWVSSNKIIK